MKLAAVRAIAELAQAEQSEVVASLCGRTAGFRPEYLIPKPFDPRLMMKIAPAVARAAADSGVATRPISTLMPTASGCRVLSMPLARHEADLHRRQEGTQETCGLL
jgi:malic enzyme